MTIGAASAFASRPNFVPFIVAFSTSPGDQISATIAMIADTPTLGAGSAEALLPTYLELQSSQQSTHPATAAAAAFVSFGSPFFWSAVIVIILSASALIYRAMHRGRDWSYPAAAAGALIAAVVISFLSPITPLATAAIPLAVLLGMGIVQSVSRTPS
jgi:hypothetical protein